MRKYYTTRNSFDFNGHRAVIRAHDLVLNRHTAHAVHERICHQVIIQTPPDVARPSIGDVCPPGVLHLIRVQHAERIAEPVFQIAGYPNPLLWQKARGRAVRFGIGKVDLLMRGVEIPGYDDVLPLPMLLIAQIQQPAIKIQLVSHPFLTSLTIGKVNVVQGKLRKAQPDYPPFVIETVVIQSKTAFQWLDATEYRHTAVSWALCRIPIRCVAIPGAVNLFDLLRTRLYLLQTDHICAIL